MGPLLVAAAARERAIMVTGEGRGSEVAPESPVGGARGKGELPGADISTEDEAGYPTGFGPIKPTSGINLLSTSPWNDYSAEDSDNPPHAVSRASPSECRKRSTPR